MSLSLVGDLIIMGLQFVVIGLLLKQMAISYEVKGILEGRNA